LIELTKNIRISEDELVFRFSRSGGPGGQNVNKVNTKVTLLFDVESSEGLTDIQKQRVLRRLGTRVDRNGVLRVVSQRHRTQGANRQAAVERLCELLREALKRKAVRKETAVPLKAKLRRLEEKRRRSLLKQERAKRHSVEE
jgi:ribosome-associated protein